METKLPIKSWAEEDRPREKLMQKGKHSLTDAELLAILIGSGNSEETAVELSRRILAQSGNSLLALGKMNASELMEFKGIGEAKAITIVAAMELSRRRKDTQEAELEKISSSNDIVSIFQSMLGDLQHEEFWVVYLNRGNKILAKKQLSSGGMSGTVVDPRMIFKSALDQKAQALILCHNHPSGTAKPSEADIRLTKNMVEAGKVLEISVLDHIIITQKAFYSFADEGMM
ncbi:MAG TPA: DNA repair protein RadC [Bacteroidia bacterium]|nr:DNA repair protein RadC [Bacteroidia bacterium]HNP99151.1 DNA repair protein RadC [Bacteroidia bacterium]